VIDGSGPRERDREVSRVFREHRNRRNQNSADRELRVDVEPRAKRRQNCGRSDFKIMLFTDVEWGSWRGIKVQQSEATWKQRDHTRERAWKLTDLEYCMRL